VIYDLLSFSGLHLQCLVLRPARHRPSADLASPAEKAVYQSKILKGKRPVSFIQSLVAALLLTILVEYAVLLLLVRKDPLQLLLYSVLINSFTNPLFNYLYNYELHQLYHLEMMVVLVEGILIALLMQVSYARALLISSSANLASLLVGLLLMG
jgi:hypothetical protein